MGLGYSKLKGDVKHGLMTQPLLLAILFQVRFVSTRGRMFVSFCTIFVKKF